MVKASIAGSGPSERVRQTMRKSKEQSRHSKAEMISQRVAELEQANAEVRESRRAALNLMEDAVESRDAIEGLNIALRDSEDRLARELEATQQLQAVSALVIRGGDIRALYQRIGDAAAAIMRSDGASFQMVDEHEDALRLLAWHGFGPEFGQSFELIRRDTGTTCGVAWQEGCRVIVPDVETCDFIAGSAALEDHRKAGIRAAQSTPLISRSGQVLGMISTHWRIPHTPTEDDLRQFDVLARLAADIFERKQADEALRRSESNLRDFLENASVGLHWVGPDGVILWANQAELDMLGYAREDYVGRHIAEFHADQPVIDDILGRLTRGETLQDREARLRHKDGSVRHVLINSNALFEDDRFIHTRCFTRDVTERKQAEERLQLVSDELAHRGRNLLAVIQAMISRSLSDGRSLAEGRDALMRRVQALARSHSMLLSAFDGAPLAEIIRLEFDIFSDRISAAGPRVMLSPKAAQSFALLVHELATNATKHGALSRPNGHVGVNWSIEGTGADARFKFHWQERGGPAVTAPTHQGFGSAVIERAVAQEFETRPQIRFDPKGLTYEIDAPLSALTAKPRNGSWQAPD